MHLLTYVRYLVWVVMYYLPYFKALQPEDRTFAFLITSVLPSDLILFQKAKCRLQAPKSVYFMSFNLTTENC